MDEEREKIIVKSLFKKIDKKEYYLSCFHLIGVRMLFVVYHMNLEIY